MALVQPSEGKTAILDRRTVRLLLAAFIWFAVWAVTPGGYGGTARFVAGYDAAVFTLLALTWLFAVKPDAVRTQMRASIDDPGRQVVLSIVLVSIVVGLAAAVAIVGHGPHATNKLERMISYGLGLGAVVGGWLLIHTTFMFRYAHLYYYDADDNDQADGGIKFPGTDMPTDYDFAYFSFVIGMTFQVSDVVVTNHGVRRVVLYHGLISFAYNTAILALAINVVAGLLH